MALSTRRPSGLKRSVETAGAVDAQNAPTAPWKRTDRVSTVTTEVQFTEKGTRGTKDVLARRPSLEAAAGGVDLRAGLRDRVSERQE